MPPTSDSKKSNPARVRPALLGRDAAAEFLSLSPSALDRLSAAGELPEPRRLGGRVAWSRRELLAWTDHDCPPRPVWAKLWKHLRDRR